MDKLKVIALPKPACEYGFTEEQLKEIFTEKGLADFHQWMDGQTQAICNGRAFNHDTREYVVACGGVAHGLVTYSWDLARYLNKPIFN